MLSDDKHIVVIGRVLLPENEGKFELTKEAKKKKSEEDMTFQIYNNVTNDGMEITSLIFTSEVETNVDPKTMKSDTIGSLKLI